MSYWTAYPFFYLHIVLCRYILNNENCFCSSL
uniref:Uncharacterized protein n=1 Tax=Arundo donax TaxID=35708 RepID=A0A0A9AE08_ARUDO